jgi:hypothetical protein
VAELMIHVNATWGKLLAERGYDAIYRNQKGGKTRMEVEPGAHEWLGVSHYAWRARRCGASATSPTSASSWRCWARPSRYSRDELVAAARDFETAYEAYAEHQRALERYWCLQVPPAGRHREAEADRRSATSWCASTGCRWSAAASGCRPRRRASACGRFGESTSGKRTSLAATRGNNRYNSAHARRPRDT